MKNNIIMRKSTDTPYDRVENYITCHSFLTATYGTIT